MRPIHFLLPLVGFCATAGHATPQGMSPGQLSAQPSVHRVGLQEMLGLSARQEEPETACNPEQWEGFVGANVAAITMPADADVRITGPGYMATMDYRVTRANLEVDEDGVVQRVTCG